MLSKLKAIEIYAKQIRKSNNIEQIHEYAELIEKLMKGLLDNLYE